MGVSDPYAAFCLDEAVYTFGSHVEAELARVGRKEKTDEAALRARQQMLAQLLSPDPETSDGGRSEQPNGYVHDPTDPVSAETAARMPPPVRFTGQQFADPADVWNRAQNKSTANT